MAFKWIKNEGQAFVLEVPKEVRNDKPTNDERSRKEVPKKVKPSAERIERLAAFF